MHFNSSIFLPFILSLKNSVVDSMAGRDRIKNLFFLLLGAVFVSGMFFLSKFIVIKILSIDIIGEIVAKRVLSMLLMTIFFMVFLSATITSLTSFYVADDLNIILSMPIGFESIFYSRFTNSLINSSWMPFGFVLPVIYGFASAIGSEASIYFLTVLILLFFLVIPVALSSIFITIIVRLFPATRIKEILIIIGITAFSLLYIWFRLFEPERFLNPDGLSTMIEFVVKFDVPGSILIPSTWATELIFDGIKNKPVNLSLLFAIISTSVALVLIASIFIERFYLDAYSRTNEGKKRGYIKSLLTQKIIDLVPAPHLYRVILTKDILEFIRQPSQWSQLILLLALLVVYIYNFKYFKNIELTGLISQWGLYFLNMGLCGLVIASLGARFVYPAISLEQRSFYLYKAAPVMMRNFVFSKFLIYAIPITLSSVIVTVISNLILQSSVEYFIISSSMSFIIGLVVSGLGISIGAIYPNFKSNDPASIPASAGGVIYMISSISAVVLLILLTVWPTAFLRFPSYATSKGNQFYIIIGLHILGIVAITLFSTIYMLNYATRRLEKYE